MSLQTIDIGTAGSASGDTVRNAFNKAKQNFTALGKAWVLAKSDYDEASTPYASTSTSWANANTIQNVDAGVHIISLSAIISCSAGDFSNAAEMKISGQGYGDLPIMLGAHSDNEYGYAQRVLVTLSSNQDLQIQYRRNGTTGVARFRGILCEIWTQP